MHKNKGLVLLLMLTIMLITVGCGDADEAGKIHSGEVTVNMKNLKYDPKNITVKKGTKITFVNMDAMEHDVIQVATKELGKVEPGWKSDVVTPGKSWSITMDKLGEFPILCVQYGHFSAGMTGKITVVE